MERAGFEQLTALMADAPRDKWRVYIDAWLGGASPDRLPGTMLL